MFGILNVHKPRGISSRDCVDRVVRLVRPHKAGHAGTLDPLASGVLVICVGRATRLVEYVQRLSKRYEASFLLGQTSETEDLEGEVIHLKDPPQPTLEEITSSTAKLTGQIMQRPPSYSALKIRGQRAYTLARQGHDVKLAERPVHVYELNVMRYDYPRLDLEISCGSGTYVRSLGRDLAESMGTAAVMSGLVRTAIGDFSLHDATLQSDITAESLVDHLQPAIRALPDFPRKSFTDDEMLRIANGMSVAREVIPNGQLFAGTDQHGKLRAIMQCKQPGELTPIRFFPEN